MKPVLLTLLVSLVLSLAGAMAFVRLGVYDVAATSSHTGIVYSLLETTMRYAVKRRASQVRVPPLDDAALQAQGAGCYRTHCAQCHGGPGEAQAPIGKSMQPLPGPLIDAARRWRPAEIYWITRHGIKMSGMPAWELRLSDAELWATTAFVVQLAGLSPADYRRARDAAPAQACGERARLSADLQPLLERSRDEQVKLAFVQHACSACHHIPGVVGPETHVGPPLVGLARRERIANGLPATRDNVIRWIRDPQSIDPRTAMPDMGVSPLHAEWMADYLLRAR